jgi:hypothetical protein
LGSFFPQSDFEEMAKLPDLIAHYQEHQIKEGDISFLGFIQKHYAGTHKGEEDHSKLPLQKHCTCLFIAVIQVPFLQVLKPVLTEVEHSLVRHNSVLAFWNGSNYYLNLLKPPKA